MITQNTSPVYVNRVHQDWMANGGVYGDGGVYYQSASNTPTLNFQFAGATAISSQITFTRASSATYYNAAGLLTSATTNTPRLDYNPATLAAQGLLIEEQRVNLLTYSADFDNAGWTKSNTTVAANVVASPTGNVDADKLVEALDVNLVHQVTQLSVTVTSLGTYTATAFVKADTRTRVRIVYIVGAGGVLADANLSAGTIGAAAAFGGGTAVSSSIQVLNNGWFRISVVGSGPAGTSGECRLELLDASGNRQYNGDGVSGLYLYGAQLEAGSFATSVIPTTTTALTRAADVASVNTLSPWYNASEGTLYVEASLISSSYSQGVLVDLGAGGSFGTTEYINWGGTQWQLNPNTAPINVLSTVTTTATAKVAAAIKANDSVISANGLIGAVDTTCAIVASPTTLSIGKAGWANANFFNGWIKRITYYPRRLSNAELQSLTT